MCESFHVSDSDLAKFLINFESVITIRLVMYKPHPVMYKPHPVMYKPHPVMYVFHSLEDQMLRAVSLGHEAVAGMCLQMEEWAAQVGKPKRTSGLVLLPEGLEDQIKALVGPGLIAAYT